MNIKVLLILIFTLFLGFIKLIYNFIKLVQKKDFTEKYLKIFNECISENNLNSGNYVWLTKNTLKIEKEIGSNGIINYRPAFQNYFINNYQVISNTMPKIHTGLAEPDDLKFCQIVLLKHIGVLEEIIKKFKYKFFNPIIWFCEFIGILIILPFIILYWSGLINENNYNRIKNNVIIKIITLLVALVSLVGSIITIVTGWENFKKIIGF